jgi:hypothetical protein
MLISTLNKTRKKISLSIMLNLPKYLQKVITESVIKSYLEIYPNLKFAFCIRGVPLHQAPKQRYLSQEFRKCHYIFISFACSIGSRHLF